MDVANDGAGTIDRVTVKETDETIKLKLFADVLWKVRRKAVPTLYPHGAGIHWDIIIAVAMSQGMRSTLADLEALVTRPHRTLQYITRDLEGMGIVATEPCPEDRRRRIIYLTPRGKQAFMNYVQYIEGEIKTLTEAGYCRPASERLCA